MKLTTKDKKILNDSGFPNEDMSQIGRAVTKTTYEIKVLDGYKKIPQKMAIKILGREEFLSGISRSAFHYSATRTKRGKTVYFDSSKFFEEDK